MKIHTLLFALLVLAVPATAAGSGWVQTLNCADLSSGTVTPQTIFNDPADICIYGSGFTDPSVDVRLENSDDIFSISVPISNGILTSVNGDKFENIPTGDYWLFVGNSNTYGEFEYTQTIMVLGDNSQKPKDDDEDEDQTPVGDVPEFSTLAAGAVLVGAGLYIRKKRKSQ